MNRIYVLQVAQLPDEKIIDMREVQIKTLPHEVFTPLEFENEWNADIDGLFFSTKQVVRFF